jgi:hypothetical protein
VEELRSGCDNLRRNITNLAFEAEDRALIESLAACCEVLKSRWGLVQGLCEGMPRTLVHGDFAAKNVRVRNGQAGLTILALDWEVAGWGVPAPDLEQVARGRRYCSLSPDLGAYWSVVRESWPHLSVEDLHRWADWGRLFRLVAMTSWASGKLAYPWARKSLAEIRIYHEEMTRALQAVGWSG